MKDIFPPKLHPKIRPSDILVEHHNTIRSGAKSLNTLGPKSKIWTQWPGDIKSEISYTKFKEYIDTWFGPKYRCNLCMNIWNPISVKCVLTLVRGLSYIFTVVFTDVLARIWSISYCSFYHFSFVSFKLLFSEDK